jgi:signal transduction histidine kinase
MQNKKSYSLLNKLIVRTSLISLILLVISGIVISLGFRNDISEDIQEGTKDMIIDMILSESFEHVYWVFALCLILLIILIYFTVKNSLKDVNTVSNFVKDIDINKEIRFPNLKTPKEINPLIESLKSSFAKIKDDMKQQREFIDNAAHELNTPIAILRANIEGMDNSKNKKELLNDLELIENVSSQMLRLSHLEKFQVTKDEKTDLVQLISDLIDSDDKYKNEINLQKNLKDLIINGNKNYLDICFKNLFDNAIHNKKQGTQIKVFIDSISGVSVINEHTIQNVNKDTDKNIFEKFWRGDKNKYSGSGLGLAIVKRIVEAHKATIIPQIDQKTFKIIIKFNLN